MKTSVFDLFKIGIGPSSSHTVGPMRAALQFASELDTAGTACSIRRLQCELYGSLALTGKGHATDRAVLLGLSGKSPELVDPAEVDRLLLEIRRRQCIQFVGKYPVPFDEVRDLLFHRELVLPGHPNGMRFSALNEAGERLASDVYYSTGGGFIVKEGTDPCRTATTGLPVPHPFSNAAEMLRQAEEKDLPIWKLMLENESALAGEQAVRERLFHLWEVMNGSIERGLATEGILPGGLNVRRRAPRLWKKIEENQTANPFLAMDQVNVFAMAVN
ncbi:MAG TPA: serine dehydratase beta chain, partial [Bryobacteraceae bacterium]|nr:serine dehydratase beta chain [Bryobacteraceae bacterium]